MLLILLSFCAFLLTQAEAQQCRLVKPKHAIGNAGGASTSSGSDIPTGSTIANVHPSSTASSSGPSASPSVTPFNYGKQPIRGVNLGGWFVLEPWITPSIFENFNDSSVVDEYTMGQKVDTDAAKSILEEHWSNWITENDFKAISAAGLNHVRMQIGYWSVPLTSSDTNYTTNVDPYIPGAWPYLLQALNWAKKYGLHVILDLHGAPGSQNGYDNSGQRTGSPQWGTADNVGRTLDIIRFIASKLGGMIDVLELLNEPTAYVPGIANLLPDFYKDGYDIVREAAGQGIKVMIMDAFLGVQSWTNFLTYPGAQGVFMDTHEYQIFNYDQLELSQPDHIKYSCQVLTQLQSFVSSNIYTIIGEWTTAPTDCAKWLNGRGVGARWDGTWQSGQPTFGSCDGYTGDMSTFSDDYKKFLRQYYEAQVAIGEAIQGWVYWTWKVENADDWSYQRGLEGGWIPQDPSDRLYPNICN